MRINELLSKFNQIQDLSISEELLGAYLEGSLGAVDSDMVGNHILTDEDIQKTIREVINSVESVEEIPDALSMFGHDLFSPFEHEIVSSSSISDFTEDFFEDFDLPQIPTEEYEMCGLPIDEKNSPMDDSLSDDEQSLDLDEDSYSGNIHDEGTFDL